MQCISNFVPITHQAWSRNDPGSAGTQMQKGEEVLCMHVLAFAYITADLLLNIRYLHRGVKVTVATPHALICKILVKGAPCSQYCLCCVLDQHQFTGVSRSRTYILPRNFLHPLHISCVNIPFVCINSSKRYLRGVDAR